MVFFFDAVDSGHARELSGSDDDRRERSGVSAHQSAELVYLHRRRLFRAAAVVLGGVDTGWTFYTPFSSTFSNTFVITAACGVFIAGFSSILTGLNFIVTIHKMRAPGMTWGRLPLFVWAQLRDILIQVLGTPVVAITLALVALERVFHVGIFDPAIGGDPILFQHLFWFYSHPAVYIMILPGMGVMSEVVSCFSRKSVFGYSFVAASSIGIAVIGFLVWGHHMFVTGKSHVCQPGLLVPELSCRRSFGHQGLQLDRDMYKGSISYDTPMLYAFGFIGLFTIGGLTGLFLATLGCGRSRHRHVFRGRPLPLRDGGRHGDGATWAACISGGRR